MNKKKLIVILIFVVMVLGGIKLWFYIKDKNQDSNDFEMQNSSGILNISPIISSEDKIKAPNIDNEGLYVVDYKWNLNNFDIPSKINVYEVKNPGNSSQILNNFVKYFKFSGSASTNDQYVTAYTNDNNGSTLYLNKQDLSINYYIDLLKNQISPTINRLSEEEIKNKLTNLINSLVNLPSGMSLETTKVERQTFNDSDFVPSSDANARVLYLEMKYRINNYEVSTNLGPPINARYYDDGTLLKLVVNLPFSMDKKVKLLPTKTLEEVKKMTTDQFKIISVKGESVESAYYSGDSIVIESVSVDSSSINYIYEAGNTDLQPFYIFHAIGIYQGKPIELEVGAPALKDYVYK